MYTYTNVHIYTCTHIHIYTCTHIHMYTYTHVHIYTCTHVHTYTCTQLGVRLAEISNLDIRDSESLRAWLWTQCSALQPHTACTQDSSHQAAFTVRTAAILTYHSCSFRQFFKENVQLMPQSLTRTFPPNPLQFVIHFSS